MRAASLGDVIAYWLEEGGEVWYASDVSARTTLSVQAPVLEKAKAMAAAVGSTVSEVIEIAIVEHLNARAEADDAPFRLITVKGRPLPAGLDLDRTNALLTAEDEATYRR